MEAVTVPYLPTGLWLMAGSLTILILLLVFGYYWFFRKKVETALGKDLKDIGSLAAVKEELQAYVNEHQRWIVDQKDELLKLETERKEQEQVRAELDGLQQECAAKDTENQALRNEVGQLENQKYFLVQTLEKIEQDKEKYSGEVQKLEAQKYEIENGLSKLDLMLSEKRQEVEQLKGEAESQRNIMSDLEKTIREKKTELGDLEYRHDFLLKKTEDLQDIEQQFDLLKKQLVETKQNLDNTRNELAVQQRLEDEASRKAKEYSTKAEELEKRRIDIKNKLEDLEQTLAKQEEQQDKVEHKLVQTEEQLSDLKQELQDTKNELEIQERFEKETARKVQEYNSEVDRLKSEEIALKSSITSLEVLAKRLNKQLASQEGDSAANEEKYRDLWYPVSFPDLFPVDTPLDEKQLLKDTAKYIKGQKLYFHERVLYAFHTAVKVNEISPLVVLAGISGTGKSELPRRYAEGMGLHFVILPVQPRWDSPQDLFGFYNYLEGRYKATELSRAMVQFELFNRPLWPLPKNWDHDRSDRMLLVLLDEMNLARVEYYFSEFLSRLETRRGIDQEDEKERAKAEIALDMGSLRQDEAPIRLFPGRNILFTGTMNEDETTQALSDKVLDRACVMRFGRPKQIVGGVDEPRINPAENGLTLDIWQSWLKDKILPSDKYQVNKWINDLNDAMDDLDRPFGHRVAQAIQSYVANYPDWVPNRIQIAMADQIEQRIMPKLRGIEISDADQPLKRIRSVIEQCEDQDLLNAFKQGSSNQQMFIWRGIDRMEQ